MEIPIENIYYLLCYAWDKLDEKDRVAVSIDSRTTLLDLLAKVLINGTRILLKRGIDKGYRETAHEVVGVKGRLLLSETLKGGYLSRLRTYCQFDEYVSDTLLNQILVSTLYRLLGVQDLDRSLKQDIRELIRMFPEVGLLELNKGHFQRVRLGRNNRFYGFLLHVCQLVFENSLPAEQSGQWKFSDFTREDKKMNRLFEAFLRNFYLREQRRYRVRREDIRWQVTPLPPTDRSFLPKMQTDITLENEDKKIIMDAKYYSRTVVERYESEKLHSANLYQLFAYLVNQRDGHPRNATARGILLYPQVNDAYDLQFQYGSQTLEVRTVDLNQPWRVIHERLLAIVN